MGTSIYVFQNLQTFLKSYEDFIDPKKELNERSIKVKDMYIRPDEKLWFVLDTDKFSNRSGISKSITFLTLKNFQSYSDGKEKLVKAGCIKYEPKDNKIIFYPKFLRRYDLKLKVDRFLYDKPKKSVKIDYRYMFFDMPFNRLILVLENEV